MSPSARFGQGKRQRLGSPGPPWPRRSSHPRGLQGCPRSYSLCSWEAKKVDVPLPLDKMRLCKRQK